MMKIINQKLALSLAMSLALIAGAHASDNEQNPDNNWVVVGAANEQSEIVAVEAEVVQQEPVVTTVAAPVVRQPQTGLGWFASKLVGTGIVCAVGEKLGYDYTPVKVATYEEKLEACRSFVQLFGGDFDVIPAAEQANLVKAYDLGKLYPYYEQLQARSTATNFAAELSKRTQNRQAEREKRQNSSASEEDQDSN